MDVTVKTDGSEIANKGRETLHVKKLELFAEMLIEEGRFTGFSRDCLVKMGARSQLRWTPGEYVDMLRKLRRRT